MVGVRVASLPSSNLPLIMVSTLVTDVVDTLADNGLPAARRSFGHFLGHDFLLGPRQVGEVLVAGFFLGAIAPGQYYGVRVVPLEGGILAALTKGGPIASGRHRAARTSTVNSPL